jgi:hypothetical protein
MERIQYVQGEWQMTHLFAYSIVVVKLATKRPRPEQKDIIKTNVKGVGCDGVYRNQLCPDRTQRQTVVYMAVRMLFLHNACISFSLFKGKLPSEECFVSG